MRFRLALLLLQQILLTTLALAQGWDNERPAWTPDGKIVFSSNRNGNWDLFIMNADGSNQTAVTSKASAELFPAVSPDGEEIAFVRDANGNADIYVINLTEGFERRITDHEKIDDWPSWYRGGASIVFDSERSGSWGIYMMDSDGSNKKVLVDQPGRDTDPHSTPNSPWIVYESERQDGSQIFAYDPNRDEEIQLTRHDREIGHPALNSAGTFVVYNTGDDFWNLHIVSIDGLNERVITSGRYDSRWGAWSPDGSSIAFESNEHGKWDIYVIHVETMVKTRLTYGAEGAQ